MVVRTYIIYTRSSALYNALISKTLTPLDDAIHYLLLPPDRGINSKPLPFSPGESMVPKRRPSESIKVLKTGCIHDSMKPMANPTLVLQQSLEQLIPITKSLSKTFTKWPPPCGLDKPGGHRFCCSSYPKQGGWEFEVVA